VCLPGLLPACDVRVGDTGVSVGVTAGKAVDEWSRSYTLAQARQIEIVSDAGPIDVTGTDGAAIEVRIDREAQAENEHAARDALNAVEIIETVSDLRVMVETRTPDRGRGRRMRRPQVTVRHRIQLPRGMTASFRSQGAPVTVEHVHATLSLTANNGSVRGSGVSGAVNAAVVNGSLTLELAAVTDPIELSAVNGSIRLVVPRQAGATLTASALNGKVSVSEALAFSPESGTPSEARTAGRLNAGGPTIRAQSTNGGVRIETARTSSPASRP
jgi:hypothetical protein